MMLRLRYGSEEAVSTSAQIARSLRDAAYRAAVALARERGAFPLFDAGAYLKSPFVQRLPQALQEDVRRHGIRNSHLLSISPHRHHFAGFRPQRHRQHRAGLRLGVHAAHARCAGPGRGIPGAGPRLPPLSGDGRRPRAAAGLLRQRADAHAHRPPARAGGGAAVLDSSISKTANVPLEADCESFKRICGLAYEWGCKGCTTYRPNDVTGAAPPLASLQWPGRPEFARGNPAWTDMVDAGRGCRFAVFVGHAGNDDRDPSPGRGRPAQPPGA